MLHVPFMEAPRAQRWYRTWAAATVLGGARLVILHACQSAIVGDAGLLTGVALALIAARIPAVVAMQLTVRVAAATRFADVIHRSLARGDSVQQSVGLSMSGTVFRGE